MIKILVMDVDGTLTDGKIHMGDNGELFKSFNVKDGCGIHDILPNHDITPIVITGRSSVITKNRCEELDIKYLFQNIKNKTEILQQMIMALGCTFEEVAYIGDDINDLECMELCGVTGCPADAAEEVKAICNFVSGKKGGEGAVRDFIDWIISEN